MYCAKWYSILCLDTFIPFDTGSLRLLSRAYPASTYYELMSMIRDDLLIHLRTYQVDLPTLRAYDAPGEFFPNIPSGERPLSNIVDKAFLTL
jgi:hypothetical protein